MRYHGHSLQLNDEEEKLFQEVKEQTGFGVKRIFMAMLDALKKPPLSQEEH